MREDDGSSSAAHDLAEALEVGVGSNFDPRRTWTSHLEGDDDDDDEGGRGGDDTIESPFKDPHQLQSQPSALQRLPSFASLTHPLARYSGSPSATGAGSGGGTGSPGGGSPSGYSGGHESDPSAPADNDHHLSSQQPSPTDPGSFTAAQSAQFLSSLGIYGGLEASSSTGGMLDASALGTYGDGMNAAVKRARVLDREGSDASGGSSPKAGKAVTTQKTREAGMTRRKVEARFSCPIEGCGSTFTR